MKKSFLILIFALILLGLPIVFADTISYDDFECNGFSCGTGWNGAWSYTGLCTITTLSSPQGVYQMRGESTCVATRNFNNLDFGTSTVSFWATATSLEAGDFCRYYYYDGSAYTQLLQLTDGADTGTLQYYTYNVTPLSSNAGIRMSAPGTTGDYCYIDTITTSGTQTAPALNIFMDAQYPVSQTNVEVQMTSNMINTGYTLRLYDASNTLFCDKTATSPSVAGTPFSVLCDMPATPQTNARAFMYQTSTPGINQTDYFNVIVPVHDTTKLKINRVYFSPQVLQGGSTEIFVLIQKGAGVTLTNSYTEITFPDNTSRRLSLEPTVNANEYRAFITDTYQVGNVSFKVRVEGGTYYDEYTNQYRIAAYNLDFVNLVNKVDQILSQVPDVQMHGTEYSPGDNGKVWLQLVDSDNQIVTNAVCFVDIYYPDGTEFRERVKMKQGDEGIYYYDFVVPDRAGVYPAVGICYSPTVESTTLISSSNIIVGTEKNTYTDTFTDNDIQWEIKEDKDNGFDFTFNLTGMTETTLETEGVISLHEYRWTGENDISMYVYNYTNSQWVLMDNKVSYTNGFDGQIDNDIQLGKYGIIGQVNLTSLGFMKNGEMSFRLTSVADGHEHTLKLDHVKFDLVSLTSPQWTALKGSSEVHVKSGFNFIPYTLCGKNGGTGCAKFITDETLMPEPQGIINDNVTLQNIYGDSFETTYTYETGTGLDCTGILEILQTKAGNTTDITNEVTHNLGTKDNCLITIPVIFDTANEAISYSFKFDNYLKWEVLWAKDIVDSQNKTIMDYCDRIASTYGVTFDPPLNHTGRGGPVGFCDRATDDLYYFYQNYQDAQAVTTSGAYESYLSESRFYQPIIKQHYDTISGYNIEEGLGPVKFIGGTEYVSGEAGKIFIQILDHGQAVTGATCDVTVWYPNATSKFIDAQSMLPADDGFYFHNFIVPSIEGVYMTDVDCNYGGPVDWYYDLAGDIDAPTVTLVTGANLLGAPSNLPGYEDWLYNSLDTTKIGNNYISEVTYDFTHTPPKAGLNNLQLVWVGETAGIATLSMKYWNWGTSTWVTLPNTLLTKSTVAASIKSPTGVDELFSNDLPAAAIQAGTSAVRVRLYSTNTQDYDVFTNMINIKNRPAEYEVNDIRGGAEIHVYNGIANAVNAAQKAQFITGNVFNLNSTGVIATRLQYSIAGTTYEETAATCRIVTNGPAGTSPLPLGPVVYNTTMTSMGDGTYYYSFTPTELGIYQARVDCDGSGRSYNAVTQYRVEDDITSISIEGLSNLIEEMNLAFFEPGSNVTQWTVSGIYQDYLNETVYMFFTGTEYNSNEDGTIAVQVLKSKAGGGNEPITGMTCNSTIMYPNGTTFESQIMTEIPALGIYQHDFITPTTEGVYIDYTTCYDGTKPYWGMHSFHVAPWANQGVADEYSIFISGTDYEPGDNGRTFIQLVRNGAGVNDAVCRMSVYKPSDTAANKTYYIQNGLLQSMGENGLYYYDFIAPSEIGIYSLVADCSVGENTTTVAPSSATVVEGSVVSGTFSNTFVEDGNYWVIDEQNNGGNNRSLVIDFEFDISSLPDPLNFAALGFRGRLQPSSPETVKFQIYNYSSSQFMDLPNELLSQSGSTDVQVANTGAGACVSVGGDCRNATGFIKIRLQDTVQTADTSTHTIRIDRLLAGGTYLVFTPVIGLSGGDEWNIRSHLTDIYNLVKFINSTTIEINGTTHNTYNYLTSTIYTLLSDINQTVHTPQNVSVTVDLTSIEQRLDTLQQIVSRMDEFTQEQIFLITDSVGQVKQISKDNFASESDIKEALSKVQANLKRFSELNDNKLPTEITAPTDNSGFDYTMLFMGGIVVVILFIALKGTTGGQTSAPNPSLKSKKQEYVLPRSRGHNMNLVRGEDYEYPRNISEGKGGIGNEKN